MHDDPENDNIKKLVLRGSDSVGLTVGCACCQQRNTTDTSSDILSLKEHSL